MSKAKQDGGADSPAMEKRGAGRPRRADEARKIGTTIPASVVALLHEQAAKEQRTIGAVLERAIVAYADKG